MQMVKLMDGQGKELDDDHADLIIDSRVKVNLIEKNRVKQTGEQDDSLDNPGEKIDLIEKETRL